MPESYLSSQSHKPFESESIQSHQKFFRVESESSHDLVKSSHKNCRVIGLQARVNVESHKIKHFSYVVSFVNMKMFTPVCSI